MPIFSYIFAEMIIRCDIIFKICIYNWLLLNSLQVISRKYGRSL